MDICVVSTWVWYERSVNFSLEVLLWDHVDCPNGECAQQKSIEDEFKFVAFELFVSGFSTTIILFCRRLYAPQTNLKLIVLLCRKTFSDFRKLGTKST